MSFDKNADNGPQPFVRQEGPSRRQRMQQPTPAPKPAASGGLGCALVGLVIVVVIALTAVALFLPPFSIGDRLFNTPYAQLNAQNSSLSTAGLTISIDPASAGSSFGVRVRQVAYDIFAGQKPATTEDAAWVKSARTTLPTALTPLTSIYVIEKQGTASNIKIAVPLPEGAEASLVDLYRFDLQSARWQFVPSHIGENSALVADFKESAAVPERLAILLPSPVIPIFGLTVDVGQGLKTEFSTQANVIYPAGLQPAASGALQGVLPAGVDIGKGYGVIPVIRNFVNPAAVDVATITTLLQNSGLRTVHIERLVDFATSKAYSGLSIDYRQIPTDQRDNFTAFISTLAQKLHNANLTLTVVVPFPTQEGRTFNTGAYDWRAIGSTTDSIQILMPLDPQAFIENGVVSSVLKWSVGEVNRTRLQVGMSVLSVQETEGSFVTAAYGDVLAPLGQITIKPTGIVQADSPVEVNLSGYAAQFGGLGASNTPSIKYYAPDGTIVGTMWLTTGNVIGKRLQQIAGYNLAGVAVLDLMATGVASDVVPTLAAYKVNQLNAENSQPVELALKWSVVTGNSVTIEATGQPGTPFVYKPQQDSIIRAELIGAQVQLGSANVRVATAVAPTATPVSTITETPVTTEAAPVTPAATVES